MFRNRFLYTLMVVFMALSFAATPALADFEEPDRNSPAPDGEVSVDAAPTPAQIYTTQFDTTPDFRFTELAGATKYQIRVFNSYDDQLVYKYKGVGVCDSGYCTLTPTKALGIYRWNKPVGRYSWSVRANQGGAWQAWSYNSSFTVLSDGFVSNFNADKKGWKGLTGTWALDGPGYLKGTPSPITWQSAFNNIYTRNFVYQVKMKRTDSATNANAIIFWGTPIPASNGWWEDGIYFQYANDQTFAIYALQNGVFKNIQNWTYSSAIRPYGWNTLTVVVQFYKVHFFINGSYVGWYDDWSGIGANTAGWAGISSAGTSGELLVDKATLDALQTYPYLVPDPAMELGKDPIMEGMVPWESPGE